MSKEKLLYIDDEFVNLQLFKFNFKNEYELFLASSGPEGLDILKSNPDIKVVISDYKMPEMNGLELIQQVKNEDFSKTCILLTAYLESEVINDAVNRDLIFKYVVKPWKKSSLHETIKEALR